MLLSCKGLRKSFGAEIVLDDVTFLLEDKEKAAVIGVNGAGKTTLFRMIAGEMEYDEGVMAKSKQLQIGYLPQLAELDTSNTVYEELSAVFEPLRKMEARLRELESLMAKLGGAELTEVMEEYSKLSLDFEQKRGYECDSRVKGVVKGLGFTAQENSQQIRTLSGGQKTRVALGKLLLSEPDLLLLDEPTNHLDIESVAWLEDYLKSYPNAVLISSHDRYFLDRLVTKVVEIENRKSKTYNGNYSFYAKHKNIDREIEIKKFFDQQKEIKRQEDIITKLKSFNREKSIKAAESKEKRLLKMDKLERPESLPDKMRLALAPRIESGNDVLDCIGLSKAFGKSVLFENVSFSIKKGDRTALIGPNGIGKTTLFRMIMGETTYRGSIIKGVNVKVGYFGQEHEGLDPSRTVFEEMRASNPSITNTEARSTLAAFVFTGDEVFKPISALSGGEKGRVALAKLMLAGANFLILDEPTNHLDLSSKEILEEALRDFSGTILYISHDRYFINNTATKIMELGRNGITVHLGDYDSYMDKKREEKRQEEESQSAQAFKKAKVLSGSQRKKQTQTAKIEKEIEEAEARIMELDKALMSDEVGTDPTEASKLFFEKTSREERLTELYDLWAIAQEGEN
ncbi:MAG: ATP-binding cassette domain-containing protein [Clostridiales bacterium]|jgi:ATP-binding cassette subfamily F protein 3|nr:ATP-binding cassette domain-containing protein [Clostridiales bacterium]